MSSTEKENVSALDKLLDKTGYTVFSLERPEIKKIVKTILKELPNSVDKKYLVDDYNPVQDEHGTRFDEAQYLEDIEAFRKKWVASL